MVRPLDVVSDILTSTENSGGKASWCSRAAKSGNLESVPDLAVRQALSEQLPKLPDESSLEGLLVAEHLVAARLRDLVLLEVRPSEELLALRVPPRVDLVQLLRMGQKNHLGRELPSGRRRERAVDTRSARASSPVGRSPRAPR